MSDETNRVAPEAQVLRTDRDAARAELSQTVAELSDKLDVRGRAADAVRDTAENTREKARHTAEIAREKAAEVSGVAQDRAVQLTTATRDRPVPLAAGVAAAIAAVIAWRLLRARRNR